MRLASFRCRGRDSFGIVRDGGIVDLGGDGRCANLKEALASAALDDLAKAVKSHPIVTPLEAALSH